MKLFLSSGMAKAKTEKYVSRPEGFFGTPWRVYAVLFIAAFIVYANTLGHYLALDDLAVIETNSYVQKGVAGIPDICTSFYWKGSSMFSGANSGIYRPVSMIVFAVEWSLTSGETVQDHLLAVAHLGHWVNVLFYGLLAVVMFRVLARLLKNFPQHLAFLATLLFIVHPVHTEVVANIKSLDEILSLLFSLLALDAAIRYTETGAVKDMAMSAGIFFLALLSKEGAVLFAIIIPLALFYFSQAEKKKLMMISGALAVSSVLWYALHSAVIYGDPAPPEKYTYMHNTLVLADGFASQLASAIRIFGRYLLLLIFPHPLRYDYSFSDNVITGFGDAMVLLTFAVCIGIFVLAVRWWKTKPVVSFGILFFFISFSLTSNIFFLIGTPQADRLLFTPSLGFCLVVAWLLMHFSKGFETGQFRIHNTSLTYAVVLLLPMTIKTVSRNGDWFSSQTLMMADALDGNSNSARIYYNAATVIIGRLAPDEMEITRFAKADSAMNFLRKAVEIDPKYDQAYFQMGVANYRRKNYEAAVQNFYQCRKINPYSDVNGNLGDALQSAKMYDSAVAVRRRVVGSKTAIPLSRVKLSESLMCVKDTAGAVAVLREGMKNERGNINNWIFLGNILGMQKQYAESKKVLEEALQISPGNKDVISALNLSRKFLGLPPMVGQ